MDPITVDELLQRLAKVCVSRDQAATNKSLTEIHCWIRGRPHKVSKEQRSVLSELGSEIQIGPKVGSVAVGSVLVRRQRGKSSPCGVRVLEGCWSASSAAPIPSAANPRAVPQGPHQSSLRKLPWLRVGSGASAPTWISARTQMICAKPPAR